MNKDTPARGTTPSISKEALLKTKAPSWSKWLWVIPFAAAFFGNISVLGNGYVWDDYDHLTHQIPAIKTLKDIFFPTGRVPDMHGTQYFRPLVILSYKWDQWAFSGTPWGHHLTVLLSHSVNTLWIYFLVIVSLAGRPSRYSVALFSSLLFAVFPVHAEVVAWVCGRDESLATNFALLSLLAYALFRRDDRWAWLGLSAFSFFLGLLSKELASAVILLVPLYDFCFYRKMVFSLSKIKRNILIYSVFGGVFACYYFLRKMALGGFGLTVIKEGINPVVTWLCSLGYYLKVCLVPVELDYFIYQVPVSPGFFLWSILSIGVMAFFFWKSLREQTGVVTFAIGAFVSILFPSLLVALTYLSETPLALRYLYFPSVGFLLMVGHYLGVERFGFSAAISIKDKVKQAIFLLLLMGYAMINFTQLPLWKNDIAFWSNVLKRRPDHGLPHNELGRAYTLAGEYDQAIEQFHLALKANYDTEGRSIACNALGYTYMQLHQLEQAVFWYKKAIELRPKDYPLPYFNVGFTGLQIIESLSKSEEPESQKMMSDLLDESAAHLLKAVEINPHYYKARYYLGICYLKMRRENAAKDQFETLIQLDPSTPWAVEAQQILMRLSGLQIQ